MTFKCETCNYESQRQLNHSRHLLSKKHLKQTGEISAFHHCPHEGCDYKNKRKCLLTQHQKTHEDFVTHKFLCQACDMSFRGKAEMKGHIQTEAHKRLVIRDYPQCTVQKNIDGVPLLCDRIDRMKAGEYLKKVNRQVKKKKIEKNTAEDEEPEAKCELSETLLRNFHYEDDVMVLKNYIKQGLAWFAEQDLNAAEYFDFVTAEEQDKMTPNQLNDAVHEVFDFIVDVMDEEQGRK